MLVNSAFEQTVAGITVAAKQRRIEMAGVTHEFDDVAWNDVEPARKERRVLDPLWIGNAGEPVVAVIRGRIMHFCQTPTEEVEYGPLDSRARNSPNRRPTLANAPDEASAI